MLTETIASRTSEEDEGSHLEADVVGVPRGTTGGCWWLSFRLVETLTPEWRNRRLNKTLRGCFRLENLNGGG